MIQPIAILLIWQFYEETGVSIKWGIKQKDFIFYFLFNTAIIPFQTVIDILFYNLMKHFRELDYIACLKAWEQDFKKNGLVHFWRGFAPIKTEIEGKSRPLDQFSFSSQFYFISYIGTNGFLMIILGVNAVMETGLNPYNDPALPILLVLNQFTFYLIEAFCIYIRKKFKIWEISDPKEQEKSTSEVPASKVDDKTVATVGKNLGDTPGKDSGIKNEEEAVPLSQDKRVITEPDSQNLSQAELKSNPRARVVQSQLENELDEEGGDIHGRKPNELGAGRNKLSVLESGSMLRRSPTQNSRSDAMNSGQKEKSDHNNSLSKFEGQANQTSYQNDRMNQFTSTLSVRVLGQHHEPKVKEDISAAGNEPAETTETIEKLLEVYQESLNQLTKKKQQLTVEQLAQHWEPIARLRAKLKDPFSKFQR